MNYAMRFICALTLIMVVLAVLAPITVWGGAPRFSTGAGLSVLELHGLKTVWGLPENERAARLLLGVLEFSPLAGLGTRFTAEFGLLAGRSLAKFDTELLLNIPLHGARAYFGGGSGILRYETRFHFTVHLAAGLKKDLFKTMTVFMDAKLLGVLQLSGGPLFLARPPLQFSPGVTFYF